MENLYTSLLVNEQVAMQRIMLQLIGTTPSGQDVRRQVLLESVLSSDVERTVFTKLMDARLLILNAEERGRFIELVHESVIRGWPRLRMWLDENREFLLWRERMATALQEWRNSGQSVDLLLRGSVMTEAQRWLQGRVEGPSTDEQKYIRQSLAAGKRRRLQAIAILITAFILFATLSAWQLIQRQRLAQSIAELQRRASLNATGDMLFVQGQLGEARQAYEASRDIAASLAQQDPQNAGLQRDLSISYIRVGDVLEKGGEKEDALKAFESALAINERLVKLDPTNTTWKSDLQWIHSRIAVAQPSGK